MTFLTDVLKKGYSEEEILTVLVESEQDRKSRRVLAKVSETVAAYRLQVNERPPSTREASDLEEDEWF